MDELTISRAELIEIATEALAASEGVTDEQKLEMCETAHKTPSILLGSWLTKDCGCLVGATYRSVLNLPAGQDHGGSESVREVLGVPMMHIGYDFDRRLRLKINWNGGGVRPVRVID